MKGVLFDMDGVLVDSEEYICKAAILMFAELGVECSPNDFKPFVGTGENRYIGGVAEKYMVQVDLSAAKKRTYEIYDLLVSGNLKPLKGAKEFVKRCRAEGLKTAVATSADRIKMEINLRELGLGTEDFDATVNGEEVLNKKPAPDIFVKAASKLGLNPSDCLVVEDAVTGVRAAKAAGCKALAVLTSFSAEELSEADWICNNLAEIPAAALSW